MDDYREDGPGWLGYIVLWAVVALMLIMIVQQGGAIDKLEHEIVTIQIKD
jgi:hypothetical protein